MRSAVEGTPPRSTLGELTVMFCDLVDSTALSDGMGLEDYRDMVGANQANASQVIYRWQNWKS